MRRLVASLACRVNGSRLYGKPLQFLDVARNVSVLAHMIALYRTEPAIGDIVLGVADGPANEPFHELARAHGIRSIRGDEKDVLRRLIQCAEAAGGTDVFRVTTESPFIYYEAIDEAWRRHVADGNDVTVIDGLPEGSHFEVFRLDALRRSHDRGDSRHRSELCSLYIREHRDEFQLAVIPVPPAVQRQDLRLTIDYPEDLVLCRRIYEAFADLAPRIPLESIIGFLDGHPALRELVAPYVSPSSLY
jgi:spore coat polysaccharide biosynthesis protein SpsF